MKFSLAISLLFLSLISCQEIERTEKPKNLIPQEKMVDVLTELYLVNAAKTYSASTMESLGMEPTQYIFEKFDVDSLQLAKSNEYYAENYEVYEAIYSKVKEKISKLETYYDTLRVREQRRKDSIYALIPRDSIIEVKKEQAIQDSIVNFTDTSKVLIPNPVSKEVPLRRNPF